jgi:hypothetical protein
MGIFDEEEKKMEKEAEAAAHAAEQRKAQLNRIARHVSEDAISYLGKHPHKHTVEVGVTENRVTLRTTSHTLEIICSGLETFEVEIDGTKTEATSRSDMARAVLHWLKRSAGAKTTVNSNM